MFGSCYGNYLKSINTDDISKAVFAESKRHRINENVSALRRSDLVVCLGSSLVINRLNTWIGFLWTMSIATTQPFAVIASRNNYLYRMRSNSICILFNRFARTPTIILSTARAFFNLQSHYQHIQHNSQPSAVRLRGVMFTGRVTSLMTCIHFLLLVKECLT